MPPLDVWLGVAVIISTLLTVILLLLPASYNGKDQKNTETGKPSPRFQVLVLGDLGRSPRMQYHALSLAKNGALVDLVGYRDSELHPQILSNSSIAIHPLSPPPKSLHTNSKPLFLLLGPLKVLFQCWTLWLVLGYRTPPAKWMLVQLPPSIPTLLLTTPICYLRNTRLLLDWHNLSHTLLALRLTRTHPLVTLSALHDSILSHAATAHLTVTTALATYLRRTHALPRSTPITPFHDRPSPTFQPLPLDPTSQSQSHSRLSTLSSLPLTAPFAPHLTSPSTNNRLHLLLSPTSWTPDEDFSILLTALTSYSHLATTTHPHLPELLAVITGKGPLQPHFESRIAALAARGDLEMVTITTAWLPRVDDYARLLACADLGVCLHRSSSGLDLPMKVVDMFGAGVPVVGWSKYESWGELVREGVNGRGFESAEGLRDVLVELLGGDGSELERLRRGAVAEGTRRWDGEWEAVVGRVVGLC